MINTQNLIDNKQAMDEWIAHFRKVRNCLPFADEQAGIAETQEAMNEAIELVIALEGQNRELRRCWMEPTPAASAKGEADEA